MKKALLICSLLFCLKGLAQPFSEKERQRFEKQAKQITIVKDRYGVPHVYAKTDAGAVFGMMYVQCEEFFDKVENSLISRTGRQSEIKGDSALFEDLWTRLFIDTVQAAQLYDQSPKWLRKLCDAYADGINLYIANHSDVKPKLIARAEPWMALMNNVPSLSGSNIDEKAFQRFYGKCSDTLIAQNNQFNSFDSEELAGSNGWAIGPSKTQSGNAMLLINPHSAYYGRLEIQITSKKGLNAYGAPFLGQFNIFQGFNEYCGWMHPVSLSDAKDLYAERIVKKDDSVFYEYNKVLRPLDTSHITIRYKHNDTLLSRNFTAYYTHHGPVVSAMDDSWVTLKTLNANIDLLAMHWKKMKARNFKQFKASLDSRVMVGSNIIYADREGNIGYWHGNFVPVKDPSLDWKRPVDGSTDATEWKGMHELDEIPFYFNPENDWLQNCNSTILYGTGIYDTLMQREKPGYMFPDGQTPRADNAISVLPKLEKMSVNDVVKAAHDPYLYGGARHIPNLLAAYDSLKENAKYTMLEKPIALLRKWDYRTDTGSVATTLSVLWLEKMIPLNIASLKKPYTNEERYSVTNGATLRTDIIRAAQQLDSLVKVVAELKNDFGTWEVSWGEINRFQRIADGESFDDTKPSWAVPGTPGFMGSLNAYVSRKTLSTKRRYGVTGNTFVAVVEFGEQLKGKSILTGGASSNPASPHFTDQVAGYITGDYKDILFYKQDVMEKAEKVYHPGEE